jgi:long-chain fatty acid transport protein
MMLPRAFRVAPLAAALASLSPLAHATNGMNLEGYGPIPLSMGGASMAYENGLGAMMNNPATLALMAEGQQLSVALHFLGPDVETKMMGSTADSDGDAYFMPAIGWGRKNGAWSYGIGMFAQGGMGTEYDSDAPFAGGQDARSELGVGRVILPLAYQVNPQLSVGATLDFVWAGLDMQAAIPMVGLIDFSDSSDFTGEATGYGLAGKLGLHYQATPTFSVGLTYHSETGLSDLETGDGDARLNGVAGKVTIKDFEWPETYAIGFAWQATPRLMLAVDYKRIEWDETMDTFRLVFKPKGGPEMDMPMPLDWEDQNVVSVGLQYQASDKLGLRIGYNHGKNPVPSSTLNPLFPAIVEEHYTAGFDYRFDQHNCLAVAVSYAPEVSQTNSASPVPFEVTHSQVSAMVGYNYRF